MGNVITDNKCNWADRRRRREERGLCNALLWQHGTRKEERGRASNASPNLISEGRRKRGGRLEREGDSAGRHEIDPGRLEGREFALPPSQIDPITTNT